MRATETHVSTLIETLRQADQIIRVWSSDFKQYFDVPKNQIIIALMRSERNDYLVDADDKIIYIF